MLNLALKWTEEYHGPNPCAHSAVVVGELTGETIADVADVNVACADLWAQSGMDRGGSMQPSRSCLSVRRELCGRMYGRN